MFTLLFFDDFYLHQRTNLSRHVGQPSLIREGTLHDPHVDPAWGYPTVFQDRESGIWRCVYQGQTASGRFVPVVAESRDGIQWELPDLAELTPIRNRLTPHQVFGIDRFGEWNGPYLDPTAVGTDAWLKAPVVTPDTGTSALQSLMVTSPDGLHWSCADEVPAWHPFGADPISYIYWNPYRRSHVISTRPKSTDRRVALVETRDWRMFSPPELALQADALDTPCAEIYGMPIFQYEQLFVGLVWVYHTDPSVDGTNKYLLGKIDCQLAYSYDGWHFQRTLRGPFLANATPGEPGSGCIYPYTVLPLGDTLRIYSSAAEGEHAQIRCQPESRQGAIVLHTLRRDGFVYLAPDGGTGELTTRPLFWRGGEPVLNVQVPRGEVRVQVLDGRGQPLAGYRYEDCQALHGDCCSWSPAWRDGSHMAALHDRIVRLQVRVTNGRLYAIRGDFEPKLAYEIDLLGESAAGPTATSA